MHRGRGFFLAGTLAAALAAGGPALSQTVPVTSLYVLIVPGSDLDQTAQEAMRIELVRLTGTRAAASDPALAGLLDNARQYVQLERATTTGQVQVLFDENALSTAIVAAGYSVWDPDRPLLWIELPALDPAVSAALSARLTTAAEERGLPITIVSAPAPTASVTTAPAATPAVSAAAATAPAGAAATAAGSAAAGSAAVAPAAAAPVDPQQALDVARRAGAAAALVAQPSASDPGMLQWTLAAPTTGGTWIGDPELAIDNATDALAGATRAIDRSPLAAYDCRIAGVADLAGFVAALAAVRAAPGISQVTVSDIDGDEVTLHLQARGSGAQLERALASDQLQATGPGTDGTLQYRYVAAH